MSLTSEQIRDMLTAKFKKEKYRLKTFGTKADSYDLANAVTQHVRALMSAARYSELRRLVNKLPKYAKSRYIQERLNATAVMAKAIQNSANSIESSRPYKRRVEDNRRDDTIKRHKHKHKHKRTKK